MPNSLKSHIETLQEMFALAANERRMKEADALAAAIEALSRAPAAKEGEDWYTDFVMPLAELVNCLPSHWPSGNAHIIRAIEPLSRQGGEYDREMIAEMLACYDGDRYTDAAVANQARLLRAAANRDAAGVHTGRTSEAGDWVFVPRVPTKAMIDAALAVKPLGQFYPGHTAAESEYMNEKYHGGERRANIYAAMIAAAPAPVVGDDARDAARYRWLRDVSVPPHNFYISVPVEFHDERYTPAQVDAAIDQAIESALTGANTQQNQSPTPPA